MGTDKLYIDGRWVRPSGSGTIEVVDASTEKVMGVVPDGTGDDVDRAVGAARTAFPTWSTVAAADRARFLRAIAEGLDARRGGLVDLISREVGSPVGFTDFAQVGFACTELTSVADIIEDYPFEARLGSSLVLREPIGVVGTITPWNFPLHQITAKVAAALSVGCTVVVKPSELAPLNAFVLAEVIDSVGLPPGVFNLVTGYGPVVGEAIATHPGVDMVSFTGSTRAGRRVTEVGAQTIKRVALELGGKSANVLLDDADLGAAIPDALFKGFMNSGQTCAAPTRILVPRRRRAEVEDMLRNGAEAFVVGDPSDPATQVGPLISDAQRERVRGYIRSGLAEGATLLTGGPEAPDGLAHGYYVRPTVFTDVHNEMTIAQEEIFGPVLVVLPYDDDDEAVAIANDTIYGLAGSVWSADQDRATAIARRLRTGWVDVNGGTYNPVAPFGGYKQSGNGREHGRAGIEEYLETKALML